MNKAGRLFLLTTLLLMGGLGETLAAGSAPALSNITEIQVKHARFGNEAASDSCGLTTGLVTDRVVKKLKDEALPAFGVMDAPIDQKKPARVDILPEIVSLQRQGIDCISWVALTTMSKETLIIAPIPQPRSVNIIYWRGGLLISSSISAHGRAVEEAIGRLAEQFATRYKADQPPPLPEFD